MLKAGAESVAELSEICAKNSSFKAPDGNCYDWIEIYNGSMKKADISGWGLSDSKKNPYKFTFPENTVIPAKKRLVVFCDKKAVSDKFIIAPFGLSADGEKAVLTDRDGNKVSEIEYPSLSDDISYSKYSDGSWGISVCSPEKANVKAEEVKTVSPPVPSHESGFYDKDFLLTFEVPSGTQVYYTLDGSTPTSESEKYTRPIRITDRSESENILSARTDISAEYATAPKQKVDKANVVRAVAVDESGNSSIIVTDTYFLGKAGAEKYRNMKVVSLVTDPSNLFDYDRGIYVTGKYFGSRGKGGASPWTAPANYTQKGDEWEREAVFEFFENGQKKLSQNVGIRIKGAATRYVFQKSFSVFARSEYGTDGFSYDFFDGESVDLNGKAVENYKSIVLRNGGNDNAYAHFRDSINQKLVSDRNFAHQSFSECIVFIDGEYWGVYQIAEKVNADYIKSHYGIKKSDTVIVKNSVLESGTEQDLKDWNSFLRKYAYADMTNPENYEEFCKEADVQNFIDYFSVQIYWSNGDWPPNNTASWKCSAFDGENPYCDGRWRLFLFDTDFSTGLYGNTYTSYNANGFSYIRSQGDNFCKTFTNLLRNPEFKKQFAVSFMDIANCNFTERKAERIIKQYSQGQRENILDTFERFYSGGLTGKSGVSRLESEYGKISDFYERRYGYAVDNMKNALGLRGSLYSLTVKNDSDSGRISVNTLDLDKVLRLWEGKYFSDYQVSITAHAYEGHKFSHWETEGIELSESQKKSSRISFRLSSDAVIRAVYE